jgi:peptide/nickel transport system permease protein
MQRFVVRRVLQSALLLWVVLTCAFFLVRLTPGGPEAALVQNPRVSQEEMARVRERFGLNEPLPVQYVRWLSAAVHLDFGRSYSYVVPVTEVIGQRLWPTVQLGLVSYLVAFLGVPLGAYAALHHGRFGDALVRVLTTFGHAAPSWWLGLSLIVLLSSTIGWFPNGQGSGSPLEWLKYIIAPAAILGLGGVVSFTRFTRSEVLEVLGQEYVRTARAKGLTERAVLLRHVLRNALVPIITLLGYLLPSVLSGALITEVVFSWPGMGRLFFEAATARDYPLIMAILTLLTGATILGTLLADITYGLVDPRVRYG